MKYNCIIIGAGAAGLAASLELTKAGKRVLMLEARNRVGGRIYTFHDGGFSRAVDVGAEFVHGDLPLTIELLRSAEISYREMEGETYQMSNDEIQKGDFFDGGWEKILGELKNLKTDMAFEDFLTKKFAGEKHQSLRSNTKRFVEGYNAADSTKASSIALREEWTQEEDPTQYRPEGGYSKLVDFLLKENLKQGLEIQLSKTVTHIQWTSSEVRVKTDTEACYSSEKVLITVPIGILQAERIQIEPSLPDYIQASKNIGFGSVVKFLFQFKDAFWQSNAAQKMPAMKFLFTDASIPTWWTQLPDTTPILTGWLGGPAAEKLGNNETQLFSLALKSLSYAFKCPASLIQENLIAFHICNWKHDPFARGAYSYATIETPSAKNLLNVPVENVLYFAGEGLYRGPHTGTVEAALSSGKNAARRMLLA